MGRSSPLRVTSGSALTDQKISAWPSEADIFAFMSHTLSEKAAIRFVEIDMTQPSRRPYTGLRVFSSPQPARYAQFLSGFVSDYTSDAKGASMPPHLTVCCNTRCPVCDAGIARSKSGEGALHMVRPETLTRCAGRCFASPGTRRPHPRER